MSRIAKMGVAVPQGVDVQIKEDQITVKGSGGELKLAPNDLVKVTAKDGALSFEPANETREANAMSGTMRQLVNNLVVGKVAARPGVAVDALLDGQHGVQALGRHGLEARLHRRRDGRPGGRGGGREDGAHGQGRAGTFRQRARPAAARSAVVCATLSRM